MKTLTFYASDSYEFQGKTIYTGLSPVALGADRMAPFRDANVFVKYDGQEILCKVVNVETWTLKTIRAGLPISLVVEPV